MRPSRAQSVHSQGRPFTVTCADGEGPEARVVLEGRLRLPDAQHLWEELQRATRTLAPGAVARIDLARVLQADGAAMAVLVQVQADLRARAVHVELVGAAGGVAELLRVYGDGEAHPSAGRPRRAETLLGCVGRGTLALLAEVKAELAFLGTFIVTLAAVARRPRSANWRELAPLMERAGADALPIVAVVSCLVGVETAYQSAVQLRRFGATLYVADLVGLSITRELGPLMTCIVVAGRSGAGFAAELGSMKVSDEIDALRALGLDPLRFLVVPRMVALVLMVPMLTLLADALGVLGGLAVAVLSLDLSGKVYFVETKTVVFAGDIFSGVAKSAVFALAIGFIACHHGLTTTGGAAGVGRRTTSSVVSILFAIIALDVLFTRLFQR